MIAPLAMAQGITLELQVSAPLPTLYADPSVFRQILLSVLTEGIALAASDSLQLAVVPDEREVCWQLSDLDAAKVARQELEHTAGFELGRALLQVYGGRIWLDETAPCRPVLCCAVPSARPPLILIIDDDADTVRLYRRYLEIHGYALQAARNGAEAWTILVKARPDAILLDVLMPKEDGWGILQRLKTMPETAGIPVVICSVLSQPQLALTLGAAQVLRKPVTADVLHRTLQSLLHQEGSSDPAPPAGP
jgi:CheY-like chemotaxis protein